MGELSVGRYFGRWSGGRRLLRRFGFGDPLDDFDGGFGWGAGAFLWAGWLCSRDMSGRTLLVPRHPTKFHAVELFGHVWTLLS